MPKYRKIFFTPLPHVKEKQLWSPFTDKETTIPSFFLRRLHYLKILVADSYTYKIRYFASPKTLHFSDPLFYNLQLSFWGVRLSGDFQLSGG